MKLHLPSFLRKAVLACFAVAACTLYSGNLATAADVILSDTDSLTIDYAEPDSITDLEGGSLQLLGDTQLLLSNCGEGDGKTYTLCTGISQLRDKNGNILPAGSYTVGDFFDTTLPGTGFWADSILVFTANGTLQFMQHDDAVNNVLTVTNRQKGPFECFYCKGVAFNNILHKPSSGRSCGSAIYEGSGGSIILKNNGAVTFQGNAAYSSSSGYYYADGGAICGGDITLNNNGNVKFNANSAVSYTYATEGGSIYGENISLCNNGNVEFNTNTARGYAHAEGGAIYSANTVVLNNNGGVIFNENTTNCTSSAYGGAIYGDTLTMCSNGNVIFCRNTASSSLDYAKGGAIYGPVSSAITLNNNRRVSFIENTVSSSYKYTSATGGGIYVSSNSCLSLNNNGPVTFSGNITNSLSSETNNAIGYGGAIYNAGNLNIQNNASVLFEKNAEVNNGTYRLRSIYVSGYEAVVSLSAAEGNSIEFHDAVYIDTGSTVNFNADYTDTAGIIHQQAGDIIFTGATTEADLLIVKGSAGTATEIENSRTTEVLTMTNLYGGRLRVEDGAIYKGYGITAMVDSYSTVRVSNATLSHSGYDLLFNSGTTLELLGSNTITGNLNMLADSTLHVDFSGNDSVTSLGNSRLTLSGDMQLLLTGAGNGDGKTYVLFADISQLMDKDGNILPVGNYTVGDYFDTTLPGTGFWADATLQLTQEGTLQLVMHDEDVMAEQEVTTHQTTPINYSYYEGVIFNDISYSGNGGAVYGGSNSTISITHNGSVTFSGNTANFSDYYSHSGAIYGNTITFSHNGSVNFIGNTISGSFSSDYIYDTLVGAIYGGKTVTMSNNGSLIFIGNSGANIGAIYGESSCDIILSNNGNVLFRENVTTHTNNDYAGIIYADDYGSILLNNNGSVQFNKNETSAFYSNHGIIHLGYSAELEINNNNIVEFSENKGRAIYGNTCSIYLHDNRKIEFRENSGVSAGGAIYATDGIISLTSNDSVTFKNNTVTQSGGAIWVGNYCTLELCNNNSVEFNKNTANISIVTYANAGAIYGGNFSLIKLNDNGNLIFNGNIVNSPTLAYGAAINARNDLFIQNNSSVLFCMNTENQNGLYRLRSIYAGWSGAVISLSAAAGNYIEFRDSLYIKSGSDFYLNENYTDEKGASISQQGDILFTGISTVEDLYKAKGSVHGTEEEIRLSRTTEVLTTTNLHGGRLRVEDGAIYQGQGIIAHNNSNATVRVKNATLDHSGYNLIFNSDTTLELAGVNHISGNVQMLSGSCLKFHVQDTHNTTAALTLENSTLSLRGAITLQLNAEEGLNPDGSYMLLTGINEPTNWVNNITVTGGVWDINDLTWINNTLYINVYKPKKIFWNNHSGDRCWNVGESINWTENESGYTYLDGVQVCFGDLGAGKVTLEGILAPSSVLVNSREDYSFEGAGSLTGGMSLTKQGSGTLTITTNNSYTGDTLIEGGTLVVAHANALGSSTVTMNGGTLEIGVTGLENTITSNGTSKLKITESVTHILTGSITNSGTLTLCGSFNASKLSKSKEWNSYVTVDNVVSTDGSGFLREGDFEVTIATGTVDSSSATVKYGEQKLVMNGGVGTGIGTMKYDNYRILSGHTASSRDIHTYDDNAGMNALISLSDGGTLNVDDDTTETWVSATGGSINLSAGTLTGNIGGNTTVSVTGTSTIYGNNSYTGGTTIEGGRLEVGHANALGTGNVTLNGGTLDLNSLPVANDIFATGGNLEGGDNFVGQLTVNGDLELGGETSTSGGILLNGGGISGGSIVDTAITVDGMGDIEISSDIRGNSSLALNNGNLIISGSNNDYTGGTTINNGSLTIGNGSSLGAGNITLNGGTLDTNGQEISNNIVNNGGTLISSYMLGKGSTLTVGKGGMNIEGNLTLAGGNLYFEGMPLNVDGKVTSTATVNVDVCDYCVINADGTVQLADFGSNVVGITSESFKNIGYGSLSYDEAQNTLSITLTHKNIWVGGKGATWIQGTNVGWANGETFAVGNRAVFNTKATITITGAVEPASALVDVDKSLTFKTSYSKKTGLYSGSIVGNGCIVKRGSGKLTMNDGNTYSGGTFIEAGTVNTKGVMSFGSGTITLSGGTLNLASKAVANDIVLTDFAMIKGGKKFLGSYTQIGGELMKGSVLNIEESATISGGVLNGSLSGVGTVTVTGEAVIGTKAKVKTNGLDISGTLTVSSKGLAMNTKTSAITVSTGGELLSEGQLKAADMEVDGGLIELHSSKASSIAITNNMNLINGADMTVYAKVKTANLTMADSQLHLGIPNSHAWAVRPTGGGSISPIPLSLSVSGSLKLTASALTLSGKIKAGNLEITDSYVNMTSGKLQTIAVKDTLTLTGDNSFIFDFDASNGKSYKLFTFKEFKSDGSALHELLGWENNGSYILKANDKNITLTVINASAWETYMDTLASGEAVATTSGDDELVASAGVESAAFVLARPATEVDPMLGKVADTLVQSTWGTAGASRAFGDTIAARGTHATALADGKGAAWISTMGGSSRISSDDAHAGADYTLTGAAFGMETRLSESSTVGLAIGNSWGKVSTFSAFPVDQDSTHQGIYGKHLLGSSTTLSWMAAHTRTESDAKLAGMACDWTQDALQLDARVDKLFAISDRTTVSAFAGMQYLATDKGECDGLSTGSLQNLRGEIGVSVAHKATDKSYIYGELSFVGDMARNNPTATVGDYRSRGANPGRAGLNLSVGASYQLNDSWSLNGSYSLELMQNQTSHSANVGATYSF